MKISVARVAAVAAIALAVVAAAYLMLGGGKNGYRVTAVFQAGGQLVKGNFVELGGRPVGRITDIELSERNDVKVTMEIDDDGVAPLHEGTTFTQRQASLSGVANRYIAMNPGPQNRPVIPDGGLIGPDKTTSVVDLDQFYDIFDAKTRKSLKTLLRQLAVAYQGRGKQANRAFKYLNPALSSTANAIGQVLKDERTFERFLIDSSRLNTALAERRDDLSALVRNANATSAAIGGQNKALAQALGLLPSTLGQASTTFANLRGTLDDLEPLMRDLRPAAQKLRPFLRDLRPVVKDGRPVIHDLRLLIDADGKSNDATDALKLAPTLNAKGATTSKNAIEALKGSQPLFAFARPYAVDVTAFISKLGQAGAVYDANGHLVRVDPTFLNFKLDGATLQQVADADREFSGLQTGKAKRCPGGATQAASDGSNPFLPSQGFDCDLSTVLPGQ